MSKSKDNKTTGGNSITNNLYLILPIFTYIIFNFFKNNFFEGYAINFIELFYMIITLILVFIVTLKKICGKSYNASENLLDQPSKYALILLFIVNLLNIFNPCKQYITYTQATILYSILLIFIFNIISHFINKNKSCKNESSKIINIVLLIFNIGLIYIAKYYNKL
jgi:hypothetical protein